MQCGRPVCVCGSTQEQGLCLTCTCSRVPRRVCTGLLRTRLGALLHAVCECLVSQALCWRCRGTVPWSCPHRAHSLAAHSDLSQEACITGVGEKAYVSFLEWPGSQLGRGQPRSWKVAAPASRHCLRAGSGASWGLAVHDLPHHLIPFAPSFLGAPPTSKHDSTPGPLHWLLFHLVLSPRHLQGFCSFTRFRCHPPSQ